MLFKQYPEKVSSKTQYQSKDIGKINRVIGIFTKLSQGLPRHDFSSPFV